MTTPLSDEHKDDIRKSRYKSVIKIWNKLNGVYHYEDRNFMLSDPLLCKVIEHYVEDVNVLRMRYKISDEKHLQSHKRAGLFTAAIMRHKPIIPLVGELTHKFDVYANEHLAIYLGINICGEHSNSKAILCLPDADWWNKWFDDFRYLLHNRNFTPESLMFVYETLSIQASPTYLKEQWASS